MDIKTWLITGASSGIGLRISKELLNRGYNVIAVSRRIPNIIHENVLCLSVDVTKPETIKEAVSKGIERFSKIDVLVNNAGIVSNIILEEETLEHMKEVMETNFFGVFNTSKVILPHFRTTNNGTIINISSHSGICPRLMGGAYCSSKFALEGLSGVLWDETQQFCRVMTVELGGYKETEIYSCNSYKEKETNIKEYKNIKEKFSYYIPYFKNDLDLAVKYIIDQAEEEKLPRRLILGKDAYSKIKNEIKNLKHDLRISKKRALKCSKYDKEFTQKVIKKVIKILLKKEN